MTDRAGAAPAQRLEEVVRRTVAQHLLFPPGSATVVGVSGGPDSLALLHLLWRLAPERRLTVLAAHLNHRLRGAESDADEAFVRETCRRWGIALTVEGADVAGVAQQRGLSVEEAARQVRYAFLGRVATAAGASSAAVGHNADDQVETVLMHFLRGAGLGGLRGMVPSTPLAGLHLGEGAVAPGTIRLVRPMLHAPRGLIEAYCAEHELRPRFDRSNLDTTYYRNRLRHELIPYLEAYNPNLREVVRRTAEVLAADHDYLAAEADRAWERAVRDQGESEVVLDLQAFRSLHLSLRRSLIRRAISHLRPPLRNLDWIHVEHAVEAVRDAAGAGVKVGLPQGLLLSVGYDTFSIGEAEWVGRPSADYPQLPDGQTTVALPVPGAAALAAGWKVLAETRRRDALSDDAFTTAHRWTAYLDRAASRERLELRARLQGERMQPLGLGGRTKKLNELMINVKVPAAYRPGYPVLASADGVLWLPGYHIDHRARVTETTTEVLIVRVVRE